MHSIELQRSLPSLMPKVIAWAMAQANVILSTGAPLDDAHLQLARRVGVREPERIRVLQTDRIPEPTDPALRQAANAVQMLGPNTAGLTLGYAVVVLRTEVSTRLLSHEFRHVQQYECFGGIEAFMPRYLQQVLQHGYFAAPLEQDARAHEIDNPSGA